MPRRVRIEYRGAVYHVLNRGNYRKALFSVQGSAELFEETLFDCCSRFGLGMKCSKHWNNIPIVVFPSFSFSLCVLPSQRLEIGRLFCSIVCGMKENKGQRYWSMPLILWRRRMCFHSILRPVALFVRHQFRNFLEMGCFRCIFFGLLFPIPGTNCSYRTLSGDMGIPENS